MAHQDTITAGERASLGAHILGSLPEDVFVGNPEDKRTTLGKLTR
jgi:hypothetical protein